MQDTVLPVSPAWQERAFIDRAKYDEMYARSITDPEGFWRDAAKRLDWIKPFTTVKDVSWDPDNFRIKWYEDGTLNASVNCIDRHLPQHALRTAIIWEGDDPRESRRITYQDLHDEVCASPTR